MVKNNYKYILIISQKNDQSTDKVIQYLSHYKSNFIRINEDDIIIDGKIFFDTSKQNNFILSFENNNTVDIDKIKFVWYRRGRLNLYNKIGVDLTPLPHEFFRVVYCHSNNKIFFVSLQNGI